VAIISAIAVINSRTKLTEKEAAYGGTGDSLIKYNLLLFENAGKPS
jgi:hypothetical protein